MKKLLSRLKSRMGSARKVRVTRAHQGSELVYLFRPIAFDEKKEAKAKEALASAKSRGLCTGFDLSRLSWGEIRVYRNLLYQDSDMSELNKCVARAVKSFIK